jgi:hypothetical protein
MKFIELKKNQDDDIILNQMRQGETFIFVKNEIKKMNGLL